MSKFGSTTFRRTSRETFRLLLGVMAVVTWGGLAHAQTVLPTDVKKTCVVPPFEFKSWFESGTVTVNGIVDPADSVTFPNVPNCSFYKWSEQMFLWLTSPAPSRYGPGTHVFNSPVFYDVSPPDGTERTLIPNVPGKFRDFRVRLSQLGPQNKPVVFDKAGKMHTLVRPELGKTGKPLIRTKKGEPIEIARIQVSPKGEPIFLDKAGKTIDHDLLRPGIPKLLDKAGKPIEFTLKQIEVNGKKFFLDAAGNAIETEQGQADGTVLMAQGGQLVYYALQVNDVYAYMLTGAKNGGITAPITHFPTTPADLNVIKAFAFTKSKIFPDPNALAVELKSSWIETTGLDVSKFVTITATIPTYNTTDPMNWVPNGSKQAKLAMVGMHVVGSTLGHPEMIWATFEHVNNTRNAPYTYRDINNAVKSVPQDAGGTWLFSMTPASATPNSSLMSLSGANIGASTLAPIGPSDLLRINPWGTAASSGQFTNNNTDLISINNSVINQLLAGDVRKNYIMTGTTWTIGGAPPGPGNQVGTNQMANTTMESFSPTSNCFSCHDSSNMLGSPSGSGLSHIWGQLKPLFP